MKYLMLCMAPVMWVGYLLLVDIPMYVAGHVVCRILATRRQYLYRNSTRWPERFLLEWKPSWAFAFANEEDGIDGLRGGLADANGYKHGQAWFDKTKRLTVQQRIVKWSAHRNPSSNLRFIKPFGFFIDPKRVYSIGNSADPGGDSKSQPKRFLWFFAWQGLYSGCWLTYRGFRIRMGWALQPNDSIGNSPDDYRSRGCGFKLQLQRNDQ